MKRLDLELAPRGWRVILITTPVWLVVGAACGGLALGLALWSSARMQAQAQVQADVRESLERRLAARSAAPRMPSTPRRTAQELLSAQQVILQLNVPWSALLDALESVPTSHVALIEIVPDARLRRLRIKAEARSPDDMIAYVSRLRSVPALSAVVLRQHEVDVQNRNRPVRFEMDATWQEPSP